jgi:hypothetical protein
LVGASNVGPTFPLTNLLRLMSEYLTDWWWKISVEMFHGKKRGMWRVRSSFDAK